MGKKPRNWKLDERKVRWIVREKRRGLLKNREIAWIQGVSVRRIQQVWREFRLSGRIPELRRPGRRGEEVPEDVREIVLKAYGAHRVGAKLMERLLAKEGVRLSHNRVQRILVEEGLALREPKKQRRRKWVKYERRHSMTLWHTDWFRLDEAFGSLKGKWLLLIEDDASRLITGYGLHESPTAEKTVEAFKEAFRSHGLPREVLTDRGSQFYANAGLKKAKGITEFEAFLAKSRVRHIVGRLHHPQTNGKVERLYRTLRDKARFFSSMEECVRWYNEPKPEGRGERINAKAFSN